MQYIDIVVDRENHGKRVDLLLSEKLTEYSRSYLQNLIKTGKANIKGKSIKSNYRVKEGDEIHLIIPPPQKIILKPEKIKLDIIHDDEDIAVINKPQGMVVHPAPGNYTGTLVNALLYQCNNLSSINGVIRPGIVHRIDKNTSGLLVIAKNNKAHRELAQQMKNNTAQRLYWALVEDNIKEDRGTINAPIARHPIDRKKMAVIWDDSSRHAITHFTVLERYGKYTLAEFQLETGRTHQIRVHTSYIRHPIVGDPLYGRSRQVFNLQGQLLHAKKLGLVHPTTKSYIEFEAPLPDYFEKILQLLRNTPKES